jgi:hypothetical protein
MKYWPGTNIMKSQHNDFNWQKKTDFMDTFRKEIHYSVAGKLGSIGRTKQGLERGEPFYIPATNAYSKAKPSKFNGKGDSV